MLIKNFRLQESSDGPVLPRKVDPELERGGGQGCVALARNLQPGAAGSHPGITAVNASLLMIQC